MTREEYEKLLDMAIKELEQKSGDDTISRADARRLIVETNRKALGCMSTKAFKILYDGIDNLPPVQPKIGHWIDADIDNAICSCCNRLNHLYGTYCKHCGAKNS